MFTFLLKIKYQVIVGAILFPTLLVNRRCGILHSWGCESGIDFATFLVLMLVIVIVIVIVILVDVNPTVVALFFEPVCSVPRASQTAPIAIGQGPRLIP